MENNYQTITHFAKNATEELVFAFSELNGQPRVDIRVCKASLENPDDLILTQSGINFSRELLPRVRQAVEKIADVFSTEMVVDVIPAGKREIRVGVNEFKGHVLAYVRYFYNDPDSGEMRPEKKGISISIEKYPSLLRGFLALEEASSGEETDSDSEDDQEPPTVLTTPAIKEEVPLPQPQPQIIEPETNRPPVKETSKKELGGDEPPSYSDVLTEKLVVIEHDAMGYSYQQLFGPYLHTASQILLVDPWIHKPYQISNLIAFIQAISVNSMSRHLHLVTSHPVDMNVNEDDVIAAYENLKQELTMLNIHFTYEMQDSAVMHDRYIKLNNGWCIELGRGLDIFQRTENKFSLEYTNQELRKCKSTRISYRRETVSQ